MQPFASWDLKGKKGHPVPRTPVDVIVYARLSLTTGAAVLVIESKNADFGSISAPIQPISRMIEPFVRVSGPDRACCLHLLPGCVRSWILSDRPDGCGRYPAASVVHCIYIALHADSCRPVLIDAESCRFLPNATVLCRFAPLFAGDGIVTLMMT